MALGVFNNVPLLKRFETAVDQIAKERLSKEDIKNLSARIACAIKHEEFEKIELTESFDKLIAQLAGVINGAFSTGSEASISRAVKLIEKLESKNGPIRPEALDSEDTLSLARELFASDSLGKALKALECAYNQNHSRLTVEQRSELARLREGFDRRGISSRPHVIPESIVNICRYNSNDNGAQTAIMPKGVGLCHIFRLANIEIKRRDYYAAPAAYECDWENSSDLWKGWMGLDLYSSCSNDIPVSSLELAKSGCADLKHLALLNVLEWVRSNGKIDTFNGQVVRTSHPGIGLKRVQWLGLLPVKIKK